MYQTANARPLGVSVVLIGTGILTFELLLHYCCLTTPCPDKNGPPKQKAVKCTVYNTIQ